MFLIVYNFMKLIKMRNSSKKSEHPISMDHEFVEVFWLNHWHKVRYDGWEPIIATDFRQPLKGAKYTIIYFVTPFNIGSGKPCPQWEGVHESRVRIWNG